MRHFRWLVFDEWPQVMRQPAFWLITLVLVLAGGGVSAAYNASVQAFNPLLAINVGATWPLLLEKVFSAAPQLPLRTD